MRSPKGLLTAVSAIVFLAAVTALPLSYSLTSLVSPDSVFRLAEEFGGTEVVVGDMLEIMVDPMPEDFARREKVIEAGKATFSAAKVRNLLDQAFSSIRAYIKTAGRESVPIDLRDLKTTFLNELRSIYDGSIEDIEMDLRELPDWADVGRFISVEEARDISGPYKIISNLPLISAAIAAVCVLLMVYGSGAGPGLRLAGLLAILASAMLLIGSLAAEPRVAGLIPDALSGPTLPVPIPVEPLALLNEASAYVLGKVRLSAAVLSILGIALVLTPNIVRSPAKRTEPSI